ncbi:hypothetical protein [Lysinibacter cavernae]|uniref:Uncharacterized protein n=1 Tax=Lysinibacter cavernae TaxID=1640652 RepID=A0A7X5R3Q5_9MICO|nr:hypothetical protein [Lysinibacter cavernae]NIH54812.1 hypothetical protein [Lysinibacter cavernae]
MNSRLFRSSVAVAVSVACLLLAGCTSSADQSNSVSSPGPTPGGSPLDKYRAALDKVNEIDANLDYEAMSVEYEKLIAECMTAEGFSYIPVPPQTEEGYSDDGLYDGYGTVKWAEVNGYGISTVDRQSESQSGYFDPNAEYVASLSETERVAYDEAMYGPQPTEDQLAAMEDSDGAVGWEMAGCQSEASKKAYPEVQESTINVDYADLIEKMNSVSDGLESEPAVLAAVAEWSACMASAGYSGFVETYDASQFMNEEYAKLYGYTEGEDGELVAPSEEPSAETSSLSTGLGAGTSAVAIAAVVPAAIDFDNYGITPSDEAIAEFRTKEIAMAVADATCLEETAVERITAEQQVERETVFVRQNKAALDRMLADVTK